MYGRTALAILSLSLVGAVFASDPLSPELEALKAKAENGNAIAQYNLGLAYATGNGVALDQAEAYVWLTLASEQGSTGKDIGLLVSGMSREILEEGKRRLAAERSGRQRRGGAAIRTMAGLAAVCPEGDAHVERVAGGRRSPACRVVRLLHHRLRRGGTRGC